RLHKLQTARGPLDQLFGGAKVIVTAGGGDVTISFLEEGKAEQIADALRRRINEIVIEQRDAYGKEYESQGSHFDCSIADFRRPVCCDRTFCGKYFPGRRRSYPG